MLRHILALGTGFCLLACGTDTVTEDDVQQTTPETGTPDTETGNPSGDTSDSGEETGGQLPDCYTDTVPDTATEYAAMIEPHLGVVPTVNAEEMVEIPLYRNGEQVYGSFNTNQIDNPARLGGKPTISNSALQRYEGVSASGAPMPEVVWIAFRRIGDLNPQNLIGSIQLIGYNTQTGATAFFESVGGINMAPWLSATARPQGDLAITGVMPGPDDPDQFNQAYFFDQQTQCVQCHQNDPFITNPFITAAQIPGSEEPVIPILGKDAPYYVLGGHNWDMRTLDVDGNACLSCHRAGMSTLAEAFLPAGYDVDQHMPPSDPGSLAASYAALVEAWNAGPENTPGARWVIPPACEDPGENIVVDSDYPHSASFNTVPIDGTGGGGGGGGGGGDEDPECPPEFDPKSSCTDGDKCLLDGTWYYCDGGVWFSF